ncbi:uncharacterized protein NPIL_548161 [Nephila pilipes]|uniref:Tetraspanin n=1 Tax=Nephila pilipes TaxID=299642 RepID=A0A8X6U617_NEPPI|nr:uncharacterized protein NPIL_548161 [Nephila pilipes]
MSVRYDKPQKLKRNPTSKSSLKKLLTAQGYKIPQVSGAAVVGISIYVNVDLWQPNKHLNIAIFFWVNILLLLSGVIIVAFSIITCFEYFFKKGMTLCLFTYFGTLVFVLQCIICALCFTWRMEIGVFLEQKLVHFVIEEYHRVDKGAGKHLAFDHLQSEYRCCGAYNYTDWKRSGWIKGRSDPNDLPVACCKTTTNMVDCKANYPDKIHKEVSLSSLLRESEHSA